MEARMEAPSRTRSSGPVLKSMSSVNKFYSSPSESAWSLSIREIDIVVDENTDIAVDAVVLLQDLTDEDVLEDKDELAQILVDALVENNVLELQRHRESRIAAGSEELLPVLKNHRHYRRADLN